MKIDKCDGKKLQHNGTFNWRGKVIFVFVVVSMDGWSINQSINQSFSAFISPQTPQMCSIHLDNVTATTTMVPVCSPHTAIGGEDKE